MNIEERIREQRTSEATRKNFMGIEGKICLIARFLGSQIINQGDSPEYLDYDSFYTTDPNEIPTFDDEFSSNEVGYSFDGLSRGVHMNITYIESQAIIKLWYKGYLVYHEEEGNLQTYIPNDIWENQIENLYKIVELQLKKKIEQYKKEEPAITKAIEKSELQKLRDRWGDII